MSGGLLHEIRLRWQGSNGRSQSVNQAIRECIISASKITINSKQRIVDTIFEASDLATQGLENPNLTDFPLRLTMIDSATIGRHTAAILNQTVNESGLQDAQTPVEAAEEICTTAEKSLDELISNYTQIRTHPAI